ncbi:Uncharacterized protein BM_BM17524 [Brugia malayi]|uniref:Ovule protein n=1 Tax=Brugia malayi TaxID=6279 RepID=A0A4E9FDP2_BRUMA|nr:Uncharacterized protein BM_BM17524 [Brugia malayi]VIO94324.1 Uncharacterized protein BM_BM17524 [Brugia malayi]
MFCQQRYQKSFSCHCYHYIDPIISISSLLQNINIFAIIQTYAKLSSSSFITGLSLSSEQCYISHPSHTNTKDNN